MLEWIGEIVEWIADAISALYNTVVSLADFISNLISSLVDFLRLIPTVLSMLTNTIGYLPNVFVIFAAACITISVTYLVVGRSHD